MGDMKSNAGYKTNVIALLRRSENDGRYPLTGQGGFTLIELLAAMGLAAVVALIGYVLFSSSNWSYKFQEDVSEAQQTVRFAMDSRFSRDIKTAGFGLPDPPFSLTFTGITNPITSPVVVTNSATGPDSITIIGIGFAAGTLLQGGNLDCNVSAAGKICLDNDATGATNANNFFLNSSGTFTYVPNRRYISLSGSNAMIELASTQSDAERAAGKVALFSPATLDRAYPDGTSVYIIQAVQYSISTTTVTTANDCTPDNPCLVSTDYTLLRGGAVPGDGQVIAENIEDIQFAYGIDASPKDGIIDDSGGATTAYEADDFSNAPVDASSIIAIRANIVARTSSKGLSLKTGAVYNRICLEDRSTDAGCTGAAKDGYRRRSLTKLIKLRNPRQGF
ncbi:MAG: PilW family protein [Deltaproteobacteria bacterium]|nr:PilW family protein [Deltaproteobacteria bacterium]